MTRSILAGIALASFTVASAQEPRPSEGTAPNQAAPEPTPEAIAAVVPVAVDTGGTGHRLVAGTWIRTDHPSAAGRPCVAFLLPPKTNPRSTYIWLASEHKWEVATAMRGTDSGLVMAVLRNDLDHPGFDLAMATPVPATLTFLFTATWGEALQAAAQEPEIDPEEEARKKELEQKAAGFQGQYDDLQTEMTELQKPLPRDEQPRDSRARMELERERRNRSTELSREMSKLRREATLQGVPLSSRRSSPTSRRPSLGAPGRAARIASTPVRASRVEAQGDREFSPMKAEDPPASGVLPGVLVARAGEGGLEVLALQDLAKLCVPQPATMSGHFQLTSATRVRLVVRIETPPSAFGYSAIQLGVAPAGQLPDELYTAPFKSRSSASSSRTYLQTELDLAPPKELTADLMEAAAEIRFNGSDEWIRIGPFTFTLKTDAQNSLVPVLEDSPSITWKRPEIDRGSIGEIPNAVLSKSIEAGGLVRAVQAHGGHRLVVRLANPNRLKLLDLQKEEWGAELLLPAESEGVVFAADAERVFVSDPGKHLLTSYSLPDLKEQKSITLPSGPPPIGIAAGYQSRTLPFALLFETELELRDPLTLERTGEAIRSSSSGGDLRLALSLIEWNSLGQLASHRLMASPEGDQFAFQLHYLFKNDRTQTVSHVLNKSPMGWSLTTGRTGVPGHNSILYSGQYAQAGKTWYVGVATQRSKIQSLKYLLPTPGPGHAAVATVSRYRTMPAAPLGIYYLNNLSDEEPVFASLAAGVIAQHITPNSSKLAPTDTLFVLPLLGKVVAVGEGQISIERFALPEGDVYPTVAGPVPLAIRGERWEYRSVETDAHPAPFTLLKGPSGAAMEDGTLTWKVPANYPLEHATFEIKFGDPPLTQTLRTPVYGLPAANIRTPGAEQATAVPTKTIIPFKGGIDQILPSHSGTLAAVVSDGNRRVTLIDLNKLEAVASYQSSTGMAAFGLGHRSLYVWHLDGNILETRQLPDLTPGRMYPVDSSARLTGFVVGSAPNSLPLLALFTDENRHTVARTVDPESLKLGPPVRFSQTLNPPDRNVPPVATPPSSGDGASFFLGGYLAVRTPAGEITLTRDSRHFSAASTHFASNGDTLIISHEARNLATNRSWSVNLGSIGFGSNAKNILWPDLSHSMVLAISQYENQERTRNARIYILDADTQELRYELDQFPEWDGMTSNLFSGKLANSRLLFASNSGALLTVAADGTRLITRKVPFARED